MRFASDLFVVFGIENNMNSPEAPFVFAIFFAIWVVLGIGSFVFFQFNKNAALKRRLWPRFVIGTSVLFIAFGWLIGFKGQQIFFVVPVLMLITVLNLRAMKFCDSCGKTIYVRPPFSTADFCPKCGVKLS